MIPAAMLEELFLLRLLAAPDPSRGETRSRVVADLKPYAGKEGFAAAEDQLSRAGQLEASGRGGARLRVTEAGRTRARAAFGVPADISPGKGGGWAWWRDRYAVPRALGMRRVDSAEALRAALLRRLYLPELPADTAEGNLRATVDLLLAKRLQTAQPGAGAFRQAALRAWLQGGPSEKPAPVPPQGGLPEDLPSFATRVRAAATGCPTGRFGDNKVFISHVWNALVSGGSAAAGQERAFKERLVRANTAGLLRLSRADLAGAHDAADVRASETPYLGEVFHFLRLD